MESIEAFKDRLQGSIVIADLGLDLPRNPNIHSEKIKISFGL
ncbi:hypothetical protein SLEP1_g38689 [Rubroshorea leprosula]|uniref:Uncharacterized protein n=1 Tax=Rubroshorea leprosula TaxID=152421 RepID=A0AAV5KY54_9ROSI|nr:hypothetical protein SLEP1_g38689 [Rubroshorea leprosula]